MNKMSVCGIKNMRDMLFLAALLYMPWSSSSYREDTYEDTLVTEVAMLMPNFDDEDGLDLFSQEELLVQQELVHEQEQNRPWIDKLLEKLQMIAGRLTSPLFYWWYKLLIKKEL